MTNPNTPGSAPAKTYTVEGRGEFPFDMMRYDCSEFATKADIAAATGENMPSTHTFGKRQITLRFKDCATTFGRPTRARWESFGWRVVEAGTGGASAPTVDQSSPAGRTAISAARLTGPALDWAVATAQRLTIKRDPMAFGVMAKPGGYWIWDDRPRGGQMEHIGTDYNPSTKWAQAGAIIEREHITTTYNALNAVSWTAYLPSRAAVHGPTPLIAAMRAYVAAELGTTVAVPTELLS